MHPCTRRHSLLFENDGQKESQITGKEAKENGLKMCANADLHKRIFFLTVLQIKRRFV